MTERHSASNPPERKEDWEHTRQVLVWYEACPDLMLSGKFGVAYYHYSPPYQESRWIDWDNTDRTPIYWWELPDLKD